MNLALASAITLMSLMPKHALAAGMMQMMPLIIEAPADDTIPATMNGCWAMTVLPPAIIINQSCTGPLTWEVTTPFDTLTSNGGKTSFQLGTHEVVYHATDTCGNMAMDTMYMTVVDSFPPVAVCVGTRSVSLDGNGMGILPAHIFDGGSIEACFIYHKIRRMNPPMGFDCTTRDNPNYLFDDEVKFCCGDVGDTILVVLRVYDRDPGPGPVSDTLLTGRFSDCMTSVIIQDKAPPELTCPPDITIECGEHIDFDTLGLPDVVDNCDSISFEFRIERELDRCGTGVIRRIIIGTDGGGQKDSCIQNIYVVNNDPFDGDSPDDLIWPEPFVMIYDCIKVPDTSQSGGPIIVDDECSMVSVSWTDEVYEFSRDACSKVIRTFKVLDWCQYDPRVSSVCTGRNGCWTFEQIIKVVDTIPPTIFRPADTIVDYLQEGCADMPVILEEATTDECFPGEEVILSYVVDMFQDGVIDRSGDGGDASGDYFVGKHWVIYSATDECANTTLDTLEIVVKDRVLPNPIAKNGLSLGLVNMGGGMIMSSITADQLNASSYDNCSAQADLIYSFSSDTSDKVRVFDCDSIGIPVVQFWVTDECGNQNFAWVNIIVEDTGNECPNNLSTTSISGLVQRHDGMSLEEIEVGLYSSASSLMTQTDDKGQYMHQDLQRAHNYKLKPQVEDDILNGMSTRDIVLLQRHLLGLNEFDQTYQLLAADVNGSGHISSGDMADMRKVILGESLEFRHGKEWLFIPESWTFADPLDPWKTPWPESYTVTNLKDPMKVHFKGYKLGDVDMSYDNLNLNLSRGQAMVNFEVMYDKSRHTLEVVNTKDIWLSGLQMGFDMIGPATMACEITSELEGWNENNYAQEDNSVRMSWHNQEGQWLPRGAVVLSISCKDNYSDFTVKLNDLLPAELYDEALEVYSITMKHGQQAHNSLMDVSARPNPFTSDLNLSFYNDADENVIVRIKNIVGAHLATKQYQVNQGWNEIQLSDLFLNQGLYLIEVSNGRETSELKVVKSN